MSRRKSTAKSKLKAISQQEQIHRWKRHFEDLQGNSAKVTHKPITIIISKQLCFVLTCWPCQKFHSRWCTGRKWHILVAVLRGNRVGGNWLMKWDEVKKKSHYTLIDWHTGREWPLNWMTVISARWRLHRPFQRKRKWHIPVARYRKELRRRVHITAWEFEGNIKPTNWTEDSWVPVSWVQRASGDRRVELRR